MPVGKYYCDYCDKEFQDSPSARKRHLQGVQHHRNRALWYDSVLHQDANQIPLHPQAFGKGFCNRFLKTFNHRTIILGGPHNLLVTSCFTWVEMEMMGFAHMEILASTNIPTKNRRVRWLKEHPVRAILASNVPFLAGFAGNLQMQVAGGSLQGHALSQSFGMSLGNLPPSLRPPPEGGYPPLPFVDWG